MSAPTSISFIIQLLNLYTTMQKQTQRRHLSIRTVSTIALAIILSGIIVPRLEARQKQTLMYEACPPGSERSGRSLSLWQDDRTGKYYLIYLGCCGDEDRVWEPEQTVGMSYDEHWSLPANYNQLVQVADYITPSARTGVYYLVGPNNVVVYERNLGSQLEEDAILSIARAEIGFN